MEHIGQHGDGPIPRHPSVELRFTFGTVEFAISPLIEPLQPALSYNDTIAILVAFSLKMSREGYRARFAEIFLTQGGGHLGDALFSDVEEESV